MASMEEQSKREAAIRLRNRLSDAHRRYMDAMSRFDEIAKRRGNFLIQTVPSVYNWSDTKLMPPTCSTWRRYSNVETSHLTARSQTASSHPNNDQRIFRHYEKWIPLTYDPSISLTLGEIRDRPQDDRCGVGALRPRREIHGEPAASYGQPRAVWGLQLEEARAEWRRRRAGQANPRG